MQRFIHDASFARTYQRYVDSIVAQDPKASFGDAFAPAVRSYLSAV